MASDIPERWTSTAARVSLASRFVLLYDHSMQDWEWEVADASRFGWTSPRMAGAQLRA